METLELQKELFKCNHISEIREKFELSPSEFVKKFTPQNVHVDTERVQTQERWKKSDRDGAIQSLIWGTLTDTYTFVDIKSSLNRAIKEKNNHDIKYFENLLKLGYEYLSIDGNHRTQLFWNYINLNEFNKTVCQVYVWKNLSTKELSKLAKISNIKPSWNEYELRNDFSQVSDFIRDISKNQSEKIKLLENKKWRRKQDRKHIESILILHNQVKNCEKFVVNKKEKENLTGKDFDSPFYENHELCYNLFGKLVDEHRNNFERPKNGMFYLVLFLLGVDLIENQKSFPSTETIKKMAMSFGEITKKIIDKGDQNLTGKKGLFDLGNRAIYIKIQKRFDYYKNIMKYE